MNISGKINIGDYVNIELDSLKLTRYKEEKHKGLKEEFELMKKFNTLVNNSSDLDVLSDKKIFLTIDVDVLDPSVLPGTGTPEPDGMLYRELAQWIKFLKKFDIVGADIVELSPDYDKSEVSTAIVSKIVRDVLMIL